MKQPFVGVGGVTERTQESWTTKLAKESGVLDRRRLLLSMHATRIVWALGRYDIMEPMRTEIGRSFVKTFDESNYQAYHVARLRLDPDEIRRDELYPFRAINTIHRLGEVVVDAIEIEGLPLGEEPKKWGKVLHRAHESKDKKYDIMLRVGPRDVYADPSTVITDLNRLMDVGGTTLDYVTLDTGDDETGVDGEVLLPLLDDAANDTTMSRRGTNFAVAGNLDARSVEADISPILANFPNTSWIAEDGLMSGTDAKGLNYGQVSAYLEESAEVLRDIDTLGWIDR